MATIGEKRLAARIKGVMEYVDDIDWLTSTSYIKNGIVQINELAVDAKLLLPESAKRTLVVNQIVKTAAFFTSNWKGADGDRTAYLMDEEVVDMLKKALAYLDIPSEELEKIMPSDERPTEPGGPTPEPSPENQRETGGKASDAPAEKVNVPESQVKETMDEMSPDSAEKRERMEEEEEEKQSFWSKPAGLITAVGSSVAGLGLLGGIALMIASRKKKKRMPATAPNRKKIRY